MPFIPNLGEAGKVLYNTIPNPGEVGKVLYNTVPNPTNSVTSVITSYRYPGMGYTFIPVPGGGLRLLSDRLSYP